jgi:hypothetical protein
MDSNVQNSLLGCALKLTIMRNRDFDESKEVIMLMDIELNGSPDYYMCMESINKIKCTNT